MNKEILQLVLADDDIDDCILFKEVLEQIPFPTTLTEFHYGDQLITWLKTASDYLPDALFLDLNMPRKNGLQCLMDIKQDEKLKLIPIFVISTSYEKKIADILYKNGANFYIRKPTEFLKLKRVINKALSLLTQEISEQPAQEKFVLTEL